MKINIWKWSEMTADEKETLLRRSETGISEVMEPVSQILSEVKARGDEALAEFSLKFDNTDLNERPARVSAQEITTAGDRVSDEIKEAIRFAIKNIRKFHQRQTIEELPMEEILPGIRAGEKAVPIDSLAIYVPNGRGCFPSMLYMAALPAIEAGVPRIAVISPPGDDGNVDAATLFTAAELGISEVYRIGGAQAIAAVAYGTQSIERCHMITGPGSRYVTAAKRLLYGTVDVGLPAGPSESIVLADESADPYLAALDLLTEAEHGSDSSALLITSSAKLAEAVKVEILKLVEELGEERKGFIRDVIGGYGGILLTEDMNQAIELTNEIATEHLQIVTKDPAADATKIRHAGEILLGPTPFAAANYAIGPNAVLPTGGNARTFSAVSVRDFIKYCSIIETDAQGIETLTGPVDALTRYEGFETHNFALTKRKG